MAEKMVQEDLFGEILNDELGMMNDGKSAIHHSSFLIPKLPVDPEPAMVRVAPGRHAWVPKDAATPPDEYVMCRWSRQADGTFAPVPVAGRYVRLDSRTATLLGFPMRAGGGAERSPRPTDGVDVSERCRYDTILRLGRAGFIDVVRVAPNTMLLDLDSWYRHLADCMDDPDRWDEGREDRETYLKANDLGGWKRFV